RQAVRGFSVRLEPISIANQAEITVYDWNGQQYEGSVCATGRAGTSGSQALPALNVARCIKKRGEAVEEVKEKTGAFQESCLYSFHRAARVCRRTAAAAGRCS